MSAPSPSLVACLWRCATVLLAGALAAGNAPAATDATLAKYENAARTQPVAVAVQLGHWAAGLSESDPRRTQALALQGVLLAGRDDAEGAEQAQREIERLGARDPAAAAAAGLVRAALAKRRGPLRQADRVVAEALGQWPADGPDWLRQRLMKLQADIKEESGKLDEAVRIRQASITLADRIGPPWRRVEERSNLALTLLLAHQIEPARHINDEALALPETQQDELARSRALMAQAFALGDSGDAAGELKAMTQAIEAARRSGSREEEVRGLANLADHYLKRGDYPTTLSISQQALPLARELSDQSAQSVALANTALALISMHRRAEGLDMMRQALAIYERTGALTLLANAYGEFGEYLEKAGYLADALQSYRQYRRLAGEVFRRDQQQAILELQENFDSERRQREIELLQRESLLQETELANHVLEQRILVAGAAAGGALLLLSGLLLRQLVQQRGALRLRNAQLRSQSEIDPLTGLANRRHLQRVMQRKGATSAFTGALLLLDLDHFKLVNDRHGHAAGDAVLVELARRLRAMLRDLDLVVRWGGEEFLIVAQGLSPQQVQGLAERLLAAVGGVPIQLAGTSMTVTASIGYASFPIEPTRMAMPWERALDLVDTALYLAKAHGRNRAYGVQSLHAQDSAELAEISRGLEAAWAAGRVALTPLSGPTAPQPVPSSAAESVT